MDGWSRLDRCLFAPWCGVLCFRHPFCLCPQLMLLSLSLRVFHLISFLFCFFSAVVIGYFRLRCSSLCPLLTDRFSCGVSHLRLQCVLQCWQLCQPKLGFRDECCKRVNRPIRFAAKSVQRRVKEKEKGKEKANTGKDEKSQSGVGYRGPAG